MVHFDDATIERIFGADDAENENPDRFKEYFYKNKAYESLTSKLPTRILVGPKGVGKSALLKRAFLDDQDTGNLALWLKPNDIVSIKTTANSESDFILKIEHWKRGLLLEIIELLFQRYFGKGSRSILPDLADGRTRDLINILTRVISENSNNSSINIYIDDIDRGWSASPQDIRNISALLNAIRDIGGEAPDIRFRMGLRSDVYFLVRTSDESTDKIERNIIWLRWINDDILRLMAKRISSFFNTGHSEAQLASMSQRQISELILSKVISPKFLGRGRWAEKSTHSILMSLTRARPRDLVKLFHLAAKNAFTDNVDIIGTTQLEKAFEPYSQERLQDIINEYKSELPEIEKLLLEMKPSRRQRRTADSFQFTTAELRSKLNKAMSHIPLSFTNGRHVNSGSLIQFLYKIDFITARKENLDGIDRKYFDQGRFLAPEFADFGYDWEIHPAYRWALQPQDINSILDNIEYA